MVGSRTRPAVIRCPRFCEFLPNPVIWISNISSLEDVLLRYRNRAAVLDGGRGTGRHVRDGKSASVGYIYILHHEHIYPVKSYFMNSRPTYLHSILKRRPMYLLTSCTARILTELKY
ncbi:hypothetical protein ABW21_db0206479 [Orbilia brochopaga]|nr:hypothetical protein ABW21_db0206479 [Drechslerella brochopaga]